MNLELVDKVANATLYEGYILYPYRLSAVKNRRRFNFGVLVPPSYAAAQNGTETSMMRTECLISGGDATRLGVRVRFLQVMDNPSDDRWLEAVEREVIVADCSLAGLANEPRRQEFCFGPVTGAVELSAARVMPRQSLASRRVSTRQTQVSAPHEEIFRVTAEVSNLTSLDGLEPTSRDEVLPQSMASTHTILMAKDGEFISLLEPPEHLRGAAAGCRNLGTWPVLAGDRGDRDVMLSSPIILYDYPEIAPESPGDLYDGAEIDEILSLRILTMTDQEKEEMRHSGERARRILERTEALPAEHFLKLHGVLRGLRHVPGEEP